MGKNETFHIHVKSEHGYSPKYPEHVFCVIGLKLCRHGHDHKLRQITKCDGKDSCTGNIYTSTSDTINKVSFVNRLWDLKLIYIHTNRYNSEITPKWVQMKLFIFMSKVNRGTLISTQNTFSVLLDSICAVTVMITHCDKSQNAMARILELSQFVTVAICDGSKHNFSDRFHRNRGYTPKCIKHVDIKVGPFQEGFLVTSIMDFITDIHAHKQICQWNNTKMGKNTTFHIHVKSESVYSPKYPEHFFKVNGL